jgi:hypothetical protein
MTLRSFFRAFLSMVTVTDVVIFPLD